MEVVRAGQKEKVVRVGLLALKQLLQDPSLGYGATLVDASLLKLVTTRSLQARDPLTFTLTLGWSVRSQSGPGHGARMMLTGGAEGLTLLRRMWCGMGWLHSTQHSTCSFPAHAAAHATKRIQSCCCASDGRH